MSQAGWINIPERGSFAMMRVGIRIMNLCGYPIGVFIGFLVTLYFFTTGTRSRAASRDYLRRLYQHDPQPSLRPTLRNIFLHHFHFALNVVDRMWFWQGNIHRFKFTDKGKEHLLQRKSGILLMGAHVGSFDALRAFSHDKNVKINVVMYRAHAQNINRLFETLSPEANLNIVELDEGSVDQVFTLKERVEAGEIVAILGDRPAPHGRKRLSLHNFLGTDAPFPQNPWILAGLLECPVYFTAGLRVGLRRYHVFVEPLADQIVLPRKTRQQALLGYMEQYVRRLEKICREHPYQWFNFYDFWHNAQEQEAESQRGDT